MTNLLGQTYQEKKGNCEFFEVVGSWTENSPTSQEEFMSDTPIIPYEVLVLVNTENAQRVAVAESIVKNDYLLVS